MNEDEDQVLERQDAGDGWDDIDASDLTDDDADTELGAEPERGSACGENTPDGDGNADQQERQPAEADAESDGQQTQQEQADQLFRLKHLDEVRQVTRDEVIALAQKGMDYDRVRRKYADYDDIRQRMELAERDLPSLRAHEDFLQEMAAGRSVDELIDDVRASTLERRLGIDRATALGRVRLDRERRQFEAEKHGAGSRQPPVQPQAGAAISRERWKQNCFLEFAKQYPAVNPKSIPSAVWTAFGKGETLVSAYARIRLQELESRQAAQEQDAKNAKRSAGSRHSAGKSSRLDELDRLWYSEE